MSSKEGKGTVKIYYKIGEEADFTIGIALCMVYFYIQNTDAVKHRGKRDTMRVKDFFKNYGSKMKSRQCRDRIQWNELAKI